MEKAGRFKKKRKTTLPVIFLKKNKKRKKLSSFFFLLSHHPLPLPPSLPHPSFSPRFFLFKHNLMSSENIQVIARVRPLHDSEASKESPTIINAEKNTMVVDASAAGGKQVFTFDHCFGQNDGQSRVFEATRPILKQVLNGYNGAIIAYGQTGSGKTYSMEGTKDEPGIVPRVTCELFNGISARYISNPNEEYSVSMSCIQLYRENIYDMLDPDGDVTLNMTAGINGVINAQCRNAEAMAALIKESATRRIVQETRMNDASSRSHAIHIITVKSRNKQNGVQRIAQLFLADLAGSECVKKTGSHGDTLEEAKSINKSLLSLRRVIMSFYEKKEHIPYRDSVLTSLLSSALGGNSKTCILICVSPVEYNRQESVATLHFGMYTNQVVNVAEKVVVQSAKILEESLDTLQRQTETMADLLRKLRIAASVHSAEGQMQTKATPSSIDMDMGEDTPPDTDIDQDFVCPLTHFAFVDPVVLADGYTYERTAAVQYLREHACPPSAVDASIDPRDIKLFFPNTALMQQMKKVC